jgi:hypothetical protein
MAVSFLTLTNTWNKIYIPYLGLLGQYIDKATEWTTGVQSLAGAMIGIFLFALAARPALGPAQLSVQWVPGVKRPRREDDHKPPSSVKVNPWSHTSTPLHVLMAWCLTKYRLRLRSLVLDWAQGQFYMCLTLRERPLFEITSLRVLVFLDTLISPSVYDRLG